MNDGSADGTQGGGNEKREDVRERERDGGKKKIDVGEWTDGGGGLEEGAESSPCEIPPKVKVDEIAPRSLDTLFSALFFIKLQNVSSGVRQSLKSHLQSSQSDSMCLFDS